MLGIWKVSSVPEETQILKGAPVNWHLISVCNYRCHYCFASYPELAKRPFLSLQKSIKIIDALGEAGVGKLTFVGGEPLLHPHWVELVKRAKQWKMTTMLVTNGRLLNEEHLRQLEGILDWAGISIDSSDEVIQAKLGRGTGDHVERSLKLWNLMGKYQIRRKLNTVVTSLNWHEDLRDFVRALNPERWKVFRILLEKGQNDKQAGPLLISPEQFSFFQSRHEALRMQGIDVAFEDNEDMRGSYLMVDAWGRFYESTEEKGHQYGPSILEVGLEKALAAISWDQDKCRRRGGFYAWEKDLQPISSSVY